jgi:hypothetical protein
VNLAGRKLARIVFVADTHGHVDPRIVEVAGTCDAVFHAGDIGAAAVLDDLAAACGLVVAVRGNNDVAGKWPVGDRQRLETLPHAVRAELPGGTVAMEHGHRIHDTRHYHRHLRRRHSDARAVIYGHTHIRCLDLDDGPWVINPGAAGRTRTKGGPSCVILVAAGDRWSLREVRFPVEAAA